MNVIFYLHLLAATVWIGGMIVVAVLVPTVRKATDDRTVIQAMAKRFGVVSWTALGVLVLTGSWMAVDFWGRTLAIKVGLVFVIALLAAWHSVMAAEMSPRVRVIGQGLILILSLVVLYLATTL